MKSKIKDSRREVFYAELHALLTAGLDFSHAFALLIDGEQDVRMKQLLQVLYDDVVAGAAGPCKVIQTDIGALRTSVWV